MHRDGKHIVCELGPRVEEATTASTLDVISGKKKTRIALTTKPEAQWIVHLGMTGRLLVTTPDGQVAAHTHARLSLASGRELRFVDPRRFGRLEFRDLGKATSFSAAGAEPLTIGAEEFVALFRARKLCIKAALLNQTLLSGVGNIYADESLFRAGIRPRRSAGRLSNGCGSIFVKSCSTQFGWEVRRSQITSMQMGRADFSSLSTVSTCVPAFPA